MIKSAREARKNIKKFGESNAKLSVGYLQCLEHGEEVKALVEAAEDALESLKTEYGNMVAMNNFGMLIGALTKFREAVNPQDSLKPEVK